MSTRTSPPRLFHGWVVAFALCTMLTIASGITFFGTPIYLAALTNGPEAFSLGAVSLAISVFLLMSGIAGLWVASLLRIVDARWVISTGAIVSGATLTAIGHVHGEVELIVAYSMLGTGFAATAVIPTSAVLTRWFTRRRATALAVAFSGLALGGALLTPLVAWLVERLGLASATLILGATYVIGIVPVTVLFAQPDPARRGTWPDGDPNTETFPEAEGIPLRSALRSKVFAVITAAFTLALLAQVGVQTHLYNAVAERLSAATATVTLSASGAASLVGRLAGTWALPRFSLTVAASALLGLQAAALLGLAFAPSTVTVLACTCAFGITTGNLQVLHPLIVADRFAGHDYGRILAYSGLLVNGGVAAGPTVVGLVRTTFHSYEVALAVAGVPACLAALLLLALGNEEPDGREEG